MGENESDYNGGSGINLESTDPAYIARKKADFDFIEMYVTIPPMSYTWYTAADPSANLEAPITYPGKKSDIITDGTQSKPTEVVKIDPT